MFFGNYSNYYYVILGLQGICAIHCMRKGNQNKWIWIIVCLPVIGSIAYAYTEMFSKGDIGNIQSNIGNIIYPAGKIKALESKLQFSDTFDNRIALADAYLASGSTEQAVELYETSLTGIFKDNEYVIKQLIHAYHKQERYADILNIAPRISRSPDFRKSQSQFFYALSLEKAGKIAEAEKELQATYSRYSNFEPRIYYGQFLLRNGKKKEAEEVFEEILKESTHLNGQQARNNKIWFSQAKEELQRIQG